MIYVVSYNYFCKRSNGTALGEGLELALACHYRVLADDADIEIGFPEVTLGLLPATGGTQRLPRLIGIQKALPLLLDGQSIDPSQALALGVVDELASKNELTAKATEWINSNTAPIQPWDVKGFRILGDAGAMTTHADTSFNANLIKIRKQTQDNYPAPVAILSAVYEGTLLPFDLALEIEAKYFAQLYVDSVSRNLMRLQLTHQKQSNQAADHFLANTPHVSSETILSFIQNLVSQLETTTIAAKDTLDKFTSRLLFSYINESMSMLAEGVIPALIENAAMQASFAIAPLAASDEIVLSLQQQAIDQATATKVASESLLVEPLQEHAQSVISLMNENGGFSKHSGAGFYDYYTDDSNHNTTEQTAEYSKRLWPMLSTHFPVADNQPDVTVVRDRLLYSQALESARCVEANLITATNADLQAVYHLGFPSWTGGPLSFIDTIGMQAFVERCQQLTQYGKHFEPSPWLLARAQREQSFY